MENGSEHNEPIMRSSSRESEGEAALNRRLHRYRNVSRALLLALCFPALLFLITPYFYWRPLRPAEGEPLGRALTADFPVNVINREATRLREEAASLNAPKVFIYDSRVLDSALSRFQQLVEAAARITTDTLAVATPPMATGEAGATGIITTGSLALRRTDPVLAPLRRKVQELGCQPCRTKRWSCWVGGWPETAHSSSRFATCWKTYICAAVCCGASTAFRSAPTRGP